MGKAVYEDDPSDEGGDFIEAGSGVASTKEAGMSEKEPGWDTKASSSTATSKPAPKAESKPAPKADAKPAPSVSRMSKEAGEAAQAKFRESSKTAPKKEMYRTLSGKMAEKKPDTSAADREKAWDSIKGAASSVGDYLSGLTKREEKHGTYVRNGKVEKYAKGGSVSSASRRGDGIASKGKTRGKIY